VNPRDLTRPHVWQPGSDTTLLLLHGTGGDERDLLNLGRALAPEASLLSPRGLVVENGMNRFFERYQDGSFNEESVRQSVSELADFVLAAQIKYGFEPAKTYAVGFSNGANTAAAMLLISPELLAGAALFGSTRPLRNYQERPDLTGKRVWIANGDHDGYAPVGATETWLGELSGFGAEVSWLRHAGGHQISPEHVQQIHSELS
jgi:phospholipase/carboxylesterase